MNFLEKIINTVVDENIIKKLFIISIIIILLSIIIIFLNFGWMRSYSVTDETNEKAKDQIEYKIESLATGRKYIEINGWAYKNGQNIGYFNNRYIIRNEETKEYKALKTEMKYKDEFFSIDSKYDCRRAGMYAKSLAIGLEKGLYQIYIEYKNDDEDILLDTGIFFNYGM